MKSRINEVTRQYLRACDKKEFPKINNISKEEKEGIKEMKEDIRRMFSCAQTRVVSWWPRSNTAM